MAHPSRSILICDWPRRIGVVALFLIAACSGDAPVPAPSSVPSPTPVPVASPAPAKASAVAAAPQRTIEASAAIAEPAQGTADASPPFTPSGRDVGEIVFVAGGDLVRLDVGHGRRSVLASGADRWCAVDPLASVAWFTRENGDSRALWVSDLRAGGSSHEVVSGIPSGVTNFVVQRAGGEIGDESTDYEVALELKLGATPSCRGRIGCEGNDAYDCRDWGDAPTKKDAPFQPDILALVDSLATCTPSADPFLIELAHRASAARAKASRSREVTRAGRIPLQGVTCLKPGNCGAVFKIVGSEWSLVVTHEEAEDAFHQDLLLYHSARRVLRVPGTGVDVSLTDARPEGVEMAYTHLSPTADSYYSRPSVTTLDGAVLWQDERAHFCGWIGGRGPLGHL